MCSTTARAGGRAGSRACATACASWSGNIPSSSAYARALREFQLGRGDPLALAREAARAAQPGSPELVDARVLEASLLLCSRDQRDFEAAGWVYAELAVLQKSAVQRKHTEAIRTAVDGDYAAAVRVYGQILQVHPTDELAPGMAHVFNYLLGNPVATTSSRRR